MVARNLLKDYDRPALQVTDQIKAETLVDKHRLTAASFSTKKHAFSLGTDSLKQLGDVADEWIAQSIASFDARALAWQCAVKFDGDFRLIDDCWRTLLLTPGCMTYFKATKEGRHIMY